MNHTEFLFAIAGPEEDVTEFKARIRGTVFDNSFTEINVREETVIDVLVLQGGSLPLNEENVLTLYTEIADNMPNIVWKLIEVTDDAALQWGSEDPNGYLSESCYVKRVIVVDFENGV